MEIVKEENRILMLNDKKEEVAYLLYPELRKNLVVLKSTFVASSLRGKGIADQLMILFCEELRRTKRKAILICSYAKEWFLKHPFYQDVLI